MGAPFIALTMPMAGFEPQPIFVNAFHIREAYPRWVRKPGANGSGPEAHDLAGTWITTSSGDEGTYPVLENYGEVTGAIRDAFK